MVARTRILGTGVLLAILVLGGYSCSTSGAGTDRWETRAGGEGRDIVFSVAAGAETNYAGGEVSKPGDGGRSMWVGFVQAVDAGGRTLWKKEYVGNGDSVIVSVKAIEDGVLVAGYVGEGSGRTGVLSRLGTDGTVLWERRFNQRRYNRALDIATKDGRILVVVSSSEETVQSSTDPAARAESDVELYEFDMFGELVQSARIGPVVSEDSAYSVEYADGVWVYAGEVERDRSGNVRGEIIGLSEDLDRVWRTVLSDTTLVGIENLGVGSYADGRAAIYAVGHYRERLVVGREKTDKVQGAQRNGFFLSLDSGGKVVELHTMQASGGGSWATLYGTVSMGPGKAVAVGEYNGSLTMDGGAVPLHHAKGDRDPVILYFTDGRLVASGSSGVAERDGFFAVDRVGACEVLIGGVVGGGESDPGGEDITLTVKALPKSKPC